LNYDVNDGAEVNLNGVNIGCFSLFICLQRMLLTVEM